MTEINGFTIQTPGATTKCIKVIGVLKTKHINTLDDGPVLQIYCKSSNDAHEFSLDIHMYN